MGLDSSPLSRQKHGAAAGPLSRRMVLNSSNAKCLEPLWFPMEHEAPVGTCGYLIRIKALNKIAMRQTPAPLIIGIIPPLLQKPHLVGTRFCISASTQLAAPCHDHDASSEDSHVFKWTIFGMKHILRCLDQIWIKTL